MKAAARRADGEKALLEAIAEMPAPDRSMGEAAPCHRRLRREHARLKPKTWYGMPAYAKDDKVVCGFDARTSSKRGTQRRLRATAANLDEGAMWPTSLALSKLTAAEEREIGHAGEEAG